MADAAFIEAVKKAAEEIGDRDVRRHAAAKHVRDNRAKYGLPVEPFDGYCGLAGKPEVELAAVEAPAEAVDARPARKPASVGQKTKRR